MSGIHDELHVFLNIQGSNGETDIEDRFMNMGRGDNVWM